MLDREARVALENLLHEPGRLARLP
jgi:hypothetical protein